jgi:hypothetical protein
MKLHWPHEMAQLHGAGSDIRYNTLRIAQDDNEQQESSSAKRSRQCANADADDDDGEQSSNDSDQQQDSSDSEGDHQRASGIRIPTPPEDHDEWQAIVSRASLAIEESGSDDNEEDGNNDDDNNDDGEDDDGNNDDDNDDGEEAGDITDCASDCFADVDQDDDSQEEEYVNEEEEEEEEEQHVRVMRSMEELEDDTQQRGWQYILIDQNDGGGFHLEAFDNVWQLRDAIYRSNVMDFRPHQLCRLSLYTLVQHFNDHRVTNDAPMAITARGKVLSTIKTANTQATKLDAWLNEHSIDDDYCFAADKYVFVNKSTRSHTACQSACCLVE